MSFACPSDVRDGCGDAAVENVEIELDLFEWIQRRNGWRKLNRDDIALASWKNSTNIIGIHSGNNRGLKIYSRK